MRKTINLMLIVTIALPSTLYIEAKTFNFTPSDFNLPARMATIILMDTEQLILL